MVAGGQKQVDKMPDYYENGPVNRATYDAARGGFDGPLGFLDGLSGVANSLGRTVSSVADARADWAEGQQATDDVWLQRLRAEQDLKLDNLKVQRGDNVRLYWALAAGAVALVFLMK